MTGLWLIYCAWFLSRCLFFTDCPAQKKVQVLQKDSWPHSNPNYSLDSWVGLDVAPADTVNLGCLKTPLTSKGSTVLCRQGCYTLVLAYFVFQLGGVGFLCLELYFCLQWVLLWNWSRASLTQDIHKFLAVFSTWTGPDNFHCQLNSRTSARKNIKWIYMFDASGQRRKNG